MDTARVRLAEALTSLALAIDLGLGLPMQTVLRTALIAVRLARAGGLDEADVAAAYYLAILRFVGCSTTSQETSFVVGDELALGDLLVVTDEEFVPLFTRVIGAGKPAAEAQVAVEKALAAIGSGLFLQNHRMHCEAGQLIAKRLGLGSRVVEGLAHTYERWDGQSTQRLAQGEGVSLPMRVVQVAYQAGQDSVTLGAAQIAARVRVRAGNQLDPTFAALLAEDPEHFLAGLDGADLTLEVLDAEPGGPVWLSGAEIDNALTAIADFGDFKSPHMLGHSRRVAAVAGAAARAASLPTSDVSQVGYAALIHDIGRVGVQAQLLCKPGTLTRSEHERIRLHSYLTGRIFADSPVLAPLGALGSAHHERLDGSGYHRGLAAPALSATARLLAAANAWCALTEARPHRPQMTEPEAASALAAQGKAGLLDRKAVDAVLTAAGQKGARTRRAASIALSEREIEVLRLLSRQQTNAVIASSLGISPKTVERHVTHIYDKLGVATRAGAAIYALENGLL
jgi:DNA-binding CsgD family transcriptional regulator